MEKLFGLLRVNVIRGVDLAIRDTISSDPYVILRMGKQKLKTRVVKRNVNPEWNEQLTLSIDDPNLPIKLQVYDKDTFSLDDKMGDAEFDIKAFVEAVKMRLHNIPSGTIICKVKPSRENCLSEESSIKWENGEVIQHMFLRLRHVECGEIELQLQWIHVPGWLDLEVYSVVIETGRPVSSTHDVKMTCFTTRVEPGNNSTGKKQYLKNLVRYSLVR